MNKTKFITVRIDEELYNKFKSHIKTNLLNSAAVIRNLIQDWVYKNTLI